MAFRPYNLPRIRPGTIAEYHECPEAETDRRNRPEWESDELDGFETYDFRFEGKTVQSKIYTKNVPDENIRVKRERLQRCYDLLEWLRVRSRLVLKLASDDMLLQSIENFHKSYKTVNNKTVTHLRSTDVSERVGFIRNGLDLFLRTNHTLNELSPNTEGFWAVNKPHRPIREDGSVPDGPKRHADEPFMGADERLRAFDRNIVVNLMRKDEIARRANGRQSTKLDEKDMNQLMCLIVHEFAHTPPNHICFRTDDHKDDFRYFQWLFLNMAQYFDPPNKFIRERDYV